MRRLEKILIIYLLGHFFAWSLMLSDRYRFYDGVRFLLRLTLPILLIVLLRFKTALRQLSEIQDLKELTFLVLPIVYIALTGYVAYSWLIGAPFENTLGLSWSYHAIIEYMIFAGVYFIVLYKTHRNNYVQTLILTLALLLFAGTIYEIPVYPRHNPQIGIWYHFTQPFIINSRLIMIPLLLSYFMKNYEFKPYCAIRFIFTLTLFLGFCFVYGLKHRFGLGGWLPRLPALTAIAYSLTLLEASNKWRLKL